VSALLTASLLLAQPIEWRDDWRKFQPAEYVATATMLTVDVAILVGFPDREARTSGGVLADDRARAWLRGDEEHERLRAQKLSDRIYQGMYLFGIAGAPTAAMVHGRSDIAAQLFMVNVEAFALTGLIQGLLTRAVGRERPFATHCASDDTSFPCNNTSARTESFISGHAAMAATGAGLTCAHHRNLPLWGGSADVLACATSILAATAVGTLRVMADKHWTSDVVLGLGLGFTVGYGLPSWLHYGTAPSIAVLPRVDAHGVGLAVSGLL
jgi:membrane-associated phospholipid phosphatase